MRLLIWKVVLPLTVISFTTFTKWWQVEIDGYNEVLRGFPLPFVCRGWQTSLSLQIFVLELIVDVCSYFVFWFFVALIAMRITGSFRVPKFVTVMLYVAAGLSVVVLGSFAMNPDNIYTMTREFNIEVLETEYRFVWQD